MGLLHRIDKFVELDGSNNMQNKDIVPIPINRRKWGYTGYISYWAIMNLCPVTWSVGASLLTVGLNGAHAMGTVVVGNFIVCLATIIAAVYGSNYHIGFSVFQRVVFGIRGAYYGVLVRSILSVVWFASQSYLGGLCVNLVLSSWSKSYMNMKNHFPDSVKMTSQELIGYVIYLIITVPSLMVPPEYYDYILATSSAATFFCGLGITIWAVKENGGSGTLMNTPITLSSSDFGWMWMYGINSWYSSLVAGIANQSDFSRFNKKPIHFYLGTLIGNTLSGFIVPLFGIICASALEEKYGVELWKPNDIGMFWLQNDYSPSRRAGAFFSGIALVYSQLAICGIGNAISGGMDLSTIFPRYINIRRGAMIILILVWPTQPWLFYNSSSVFISVMSSFSVFVTPMVAVYICEYFLVRRCIIKLSDCYINSSKSIYWYHQGINWKGIVISILGSAPGLPGLINAANPKIKISRGIENFYYGSFIFQFVTTFAMYAIVSFIWKPEVGTRDNVDYFNSYTEEECMKLGIIPYNGQLPEDISETESDEYKKDLVVQTVKHSKE